MHAIVSGMPGPSSTWTRISRRLWRGLLQAPHQFGCDNLVLRLDLQHLLERGHAFAYSYDWNVPPLNLLEHHTWESRRTRLQAAEVFRHRASPVEELAREAALCKRALERGLDRLVAPIAKRLPVCRIPEQRLITL